MLIQVDLPRGSPTQTHNGQTRVLSKQQTIHVY